MRYSQPSASAARITTPANATGTNPTLVTSFPVTFVLIGPCGYERSRSERPSSTLNVPSVATIDGNWSTRMRNALHTPAPIPTPTTASTPGTMARPVVVGVSVNDATTTHIVMSAATETSKPPTSSATACPNETMMSGIAWRSRLLRFDLLRNTDECTSA